MVKPIVFIDLDRTLFKTEEFSFALADIIAKHSDTTQDEFFKTLKRGDYYVYSGDWRYYDFFRHAGDLGYSETEITQIAQDEIKGDDYIYEDAKTFLQTLPSLDVHAMILTYGHDSFQKLKAGICRELDDVPIHIVLEPKARWIQNNYKEDRGYLIEDKPGQNLGDSFTEIIIDRRSKLGLRKTSEGFVINHLQEAVDIIDKAR